MVHKQSGRQGIFQNVDFENLDLLIRRFEHLFSVVVPFTAVASALVIIGILIFSLGSSPLIAFKALFEGAFGTTYDIATSLNRATPLILTGLGLAVAYSGNVFNIGGEGQILMGGLAATIVGVYVKGLPPYIHLPLALIAGFVGGAIWGLIPGYFYAKNGTNLIITTIMLNSVADGIIQMMVKGPIQEPPGNYPQSPLIQTTAELPLILPGTRLHLGLILAFLAIVLFYIILYRMPFGYEIRTVGQNTTAARHAGINVFRTQILLMLISGGLAGLAGASEILGAQYRLRAAFLPGYGYDAVAVALLGQNNPIGVIISGIMFGTLKSGAGGMQRATNLPMSLISVTSGLIILFVAASVIMNKLPRYLAKRRSGGKADDFSAQKPPQQLKKETDHGV